MGLRVKGYKVLNLCSQEKDKTIFTAAKEALGLTRIESFTVDHCANSYGGVLESADGWKLVFSGDTRPCMNVVQAAKNATVLIHEVTRLGPQSPSSHLRHCLLIEIAGRVRLLANRKLLFIQAAKYALGVGCFTSLPRY